MKIKIDIKVQGAQSGSQADSTLMFSKTVSPSNAEILNEVYRQNKCDYSSLCAFKSQYNDKYVLVHWQPGFENFENAGRFYCTRAMYEVAYEDFCRCDLSSLISALPELEHFASPRYDVDPIEITVSESGSRGTAVDETLKKYIWMAIASGKRLYIRMDKSEDCFANSLLSSKRLHSLLAALNALPDVVRHNVSFAFSLNAEFASKKGDGPFPGIWIVAYYPDEAHAVDTSDGLVIEWKGNSVNPCEDLSAYETMATDAEGVASLVKNKSVYVGWKQICAALAEAKKYVDNALATEDYAAVSKIYDGLCSYRKNDIIRFLVNRIAKVGLMSLTDVDILNRYAARTSNLDVILEKAMMSTKVSADVKKSIMEKFSDSVHVQQAVQNLAQTLTIRERYQNFGSDLYQLSYDDLCLDDATDDEFAAIYEGLRNKQYNGVDLKKIPGSKAFPARYLKIVVKRNPSSISDSGFRKTICDNGLADASLWEWLFKNGLIKCPEHLADWVKCFDKAIVSDAVSRYIEVNTPTCVDILKLKLTTKLPFAYEDYLAENPALPLGELVDFCRDLSSQQKKSVYETLSGRKLTDLKEWEVRYEALGVAPEILDDRYFFNPDTGVIAFAEMLRIYKAYQNDAQVKAYVEERVLSVAMDKPEDKELHKVMSAMAKVNKKFKEKMPTSSGNRFLPLLFSQTGAKVAWGLVGILTVVVIILSSVLASSDKNELPENKEIMMEASDSTAAGDTTLMSAPEIENQDTVEINN